MKKQKTKFNKSKLFARVMLVILLVASAVSLFGCYFGPTIGYRWYVNTHEEFVQKIEEFNSINDGVIDTFISFDLDENEEVSERWYWFVTSAIKTAKEKLGLCDKICNTYAIYQLFYLKANTQNNEHEDCAFKIACFYRDAQYNFSENDKIEVKKGTTFNGEVVPEQQCGEFQDEYKDFGIDYSNLPENMIYNYSNHYEFFVNDKEFMCIHISSVDEVSEEKYEEIIQMLLDNMVVINVEG